ncbi:hypothetical protein WN55_04889 [Dufourea novaeangliae]|uniref:Uncharacterized protein n=1 Tax=Dufourea novaeangliae TaxID=178035 RepID=A0A154PMA9_DUFNO|nr:hypothetical protein WN55_04889 [Dufourea novaeangliae]
MRIGKQARFKHTSLHGGITSTDEKVFRVGAKSSRSRERKTEGRRDRERVEGSKSVVGAVHVRAKASTTFRCEGADSEGVAHTARDRAAELQAEVRSAIRALHGWCPRPPQGHRGDTVLMSPQTQMRGNHRNGVPTQQPPPATVVVSSTSSMRPPPPPPPPRARASNEGKGHHEEPTSSIPDLDLIFYTLRVGTVQRAKLYQFTLSQRIDTRKSGSSLEGSRVFDLVARGEGPRITYSLVTAPDVGDRDVDPSKEAKDLRSSPRNCEIEDYVEAEFARQCTYTGSHFMGKEPSAWWPVIYSLSREARNTGTSSVKAKWGEGLRGRGILAGL